MIRSLLLRNAGPFRGEHRLELGPKAYAITARRTFDPGLSNWAGKSFLFEMVDFALHGRLAKHRGFDADGWITRGEKSGLVALELEGGWVASRERRRGQATQVRFEGPGGKAAQAEASAAIAKYLRFEADDFPNVAYFEQGEAKRLVRTPSEKRFDIIRGWFGLEKADAAETAAGRIAAAKVRELQSARGKLDAVRAMIEGLGEEVDVSKVEELRAEVEQQLEKAAEARRSRAALEDGRGAIARFEELVALGKQLAAEIEKIPADAEERARAAEEARADLRAAAAERRAERDAKKRVALGLFDGACPVAPIDCPAKARINADRESSKEVLRAAEERLAAALRALEDLVEEQGDVGNQASLLVTKRAEIERVRARAQELQPRVKEARATLKTQAPETAFDEDGLRRVHAEAMRTISEAEAKRAHRKRLEAEEKRHAEEVERLIAEVQIATAARDCIRGGTRRVVDRNLRAITAESASSMREAGIDLEVDIRWEREGKDPAKACDLCGQAFPASARVKECASCGAPRGQNMIQRLEFVLSDRSGAADDLAGVFIQLAAGGWLLRERESPWATAMLDEPLASVDRSNRRALGGKLVKLLGSGAFRQSMIISHSPEISDLYPGRIEIIVERDGQRRVEVQG